MGLDNMAFLPITHDFYRPLLFGESAKDNRPIPTENNLKLMQKDSWTLLYVLVSWLILVDTFIKINHNCEHKDKFL